MSFVSETVRCTRVAAIVKKIGAHAPSRLHRSPPRSTSPLCDEFNFVAPPAAVNYTAVHRAPYPAGRPAGSARTLVQATYAHSIIISIRCVRAGTDTYVPGFGRRR